MIKPINGMLLVKQEESGEKKTSSGLVLSAAFSDSGPKRGKIVEVGTGEYNAFTGTAVDMSEFNIGDTVLYPEHSGTEVEDEEMNKYLLIHYKSIMAKVSG